jgi:rare lipoprotein A
MFKGRIKLYLYTGWIGLSLAFLGLAGCTTGKADIHEETVLDTQIGYATFYAKHFQGDRTASGLKFDNRKAVAAHPSYPFGTVARVTNLENAKSVSVAIVDRGPYGKNRREGAIVDLSRAAAERLDMIHDGQVRVRVEVLIWGDGDLRDKVQSAAGNERH